MAADGALQRSEQASLCCLGWHAGNGTQWREKGEHRKAGRAEEEQSRHSTRPRGQAKKRKKGASEQGRGLQRSETPIDPTRSCMGHSKSCQLAASG